MLIDIITIFPEMFRPVLDASILGIAREKGLVETRLTYLRDFTEDRHRSVDDRPFGGGPGMILKVEPVVKAVRALEAEGPPPVRLLMSPQGERFTQSIAEKLAREERLLIIAGRYEGYDERIRTVLSPREISIGDYVLTGGELPAMVIVDAVTRLVPGVLGAADATDEESFSINSGGTGCRGRILEYPQYTRPREFEGRAVPEALLSGDHARIAEWRRSQAEDRTRERRPDLLGEA